MVISHLYRYCLSVPQFSWEEEFNIFWDHWVPDQNSLNKLQFLLTIFPTLQKGDNTFHRYFPHGSIVSLPKMHKAMSILK